MASSPTLPRRHWLVSLACMGAVLPAAVQPTIAAAASPGDSWPRRFHNADGSWTRLAAPPTRILSTSVTVTGTLLAIGAPLVASASAANGKFFAQWAHVARQRNIGNLWPAGRVDLEAVYAAAPDLIIVSATGADSARDQLARFRAVAPTIVVDYGRQSWQGLAQELAGATGLQAQASQRIEAFGRTVARARLALKLPHGQVNVISYNGPGTANPVATRDGVHGQLLRALGFDVEAPDPRWHSTQDAASDFIWTPYEFLPQLKASTTLLLRATEATAAAMLADPLLANLPSVRSRQVHALGLNAFRIDYYSATELVERIVRLFGN